MKKMVTALLVCLVLFSVFAATPAVAAAEKGGAGPAVLSFFLPGVGEWSNNDFQGSYPFAECLVGWICFPFMISSVVDAATGGADTDIRFDFWTSPNP